MSALVNEAVVDLFAIAPAPRPWRRALAWTAIVALACVWIERGILWSPPIVLNDQHALMSLEIAFTESHCGGLWQVTGLGLMHSFETQPELRTVPISSVAARIAGSLKAYCDSATSTSVVNEPSLKFVARGIFAVAPNISFRAIGMTLRWIRVVILLVVVWLLLSSGLSVLAAFAIAASGFAVLDALQGFVYSVYSFLFIVPLLLVCGYAAVSPSTLSARRLAAVAFAGGIVSGIGYNFRTSHLVVFLALSLTAAWILTAGLAGRARWWRAVLFVLVAIAGQATFQWFVTRGIPRDNKQYVYHVVWHPVVLALAIPENRFSQLQGIAWNDSVGLTLARQVQPGVDSMQYGYDAALRKYYFGLWRQWPREMAALYLHKARISIEILHAHDIGPPISWFRPVARVMPNGFALLWVNAVGLVVALAWFARARKPIAALMALTLVVVVLMQVEAALVVSVYVVSYHNVFVFFSGMSIILFLQLLIDEGLRRLDAQPALIPTHAQQI